MRHTISFQNAFRGIWTAITSQPNLRIHFLIGSIVIFAASYLNATTIELIVLTLTISSVVLAEMCNTSIEFFCNAITTEHNLYIKQAKDVAAGAVLLSAIFAAIIGMMIFIPKIFTS